MLNLVAVVALIVAVSAAAPQPVAGGTDAVTYEVVSVDVNGDVPAEGGEEQWGNMQMFARYSLSDDGTKVVFARRNGLEDDPGYVPFGHGERCVAGYCQDLYVRDLTAGVTESATAGLQVGNAHELSRPTIGSAGASWAVSADAETFLFSWSCRFEHGHGAEVIGGTEVCGPGSSFEEREVLVVFSRPTGAAEVLSTAYGGSRRAPDISADGDTVIFSERGTAPGHCLRADWECEDGEVLRLWRRGAGTTTVTRMVGHYGSGDDSGGWQVLSTALAGNGSAVYLLANAYGGHGPDDHHLFVYDVATASIEELPIPDEDFAGGTGGIVGASRDGAAVALSSAAAGPAALVMVDVPARTSRVVPGAVCQQGGSASQSVSADGRYVGCWRYNLYDEVERRPYSPAIVDTWTGESVAIATGREGFSVYYRDPRINADGTRAVFGAALGEDQPHQVWIATLGERPPLPSGPPRESTAACPADRVPPSGFTDIAANTHEHNIDCVAWWRVTSGVGSNQYGPALPVRRDQMASFLARLILDSGGRLPDADAHPGFADTPGNAHEANIRRLAAAGVVAGTSADTYAPVAPVRREQMATFLVRAYEHRTGERLTSSREHFTDTAGSVHRDNINRAAEAAFASGTTATTFAPAQEVRRDQMASFLARVLNRIVDRGHATPPG